MNTCKTCNRWKKAEDINYHRESLAFEIGLGICTCDKFDYSYSDMENTPLDGVVVENDEGWGFYTGPNFGCIHYRKGE